ncbi:hypothetical protein FNF29_07236 [Cafeteria roenbergensis]|uniref:Uncharacterized protein n=1 Tax=Cafeteria roenbergensis TaxID=33653 RepID=A0A5A8C4P0_CAFRO|nr:hypothetical protein FNF29_07236 [Cafeteria roenbergensis]|eukprot:KAA0147684.1 hypothetical protein FNF29_07236 [Cafeteria roenbergensis]
MAAAALSRGDMGRALWDAAGAGNTGEVTRLLGEGAPVNWANCRDGQTPLVRAAQKGHAESMRVLLNRGADLEAKNKDGRTALMWAAFSGKSLIMALLLDRGAALEAKDKNDSTALMWAAHHVKVEALALLLDRGAGLACKNKNGWTALLWAAWNGKVEAVALLLDRGADLDAKNNGDTTALMMAAQNGKGGVMASLLERGADLEVKDNVRMAGQHSSGLPGIAMWKLWRCCWTAAPTRRSETMMAGPPSICAGRALAGVRFLALSTSSAGVAGVCL